MNHIKQITRAAALVALSIAVTLSGVSSARAADHESWEAMRERAQKQIDEDPQIAIAWRDLGTAQYHLGEFENAAETLAKANEMGAPSTAEVRYLLALTNIALEEREKALDWLSRAVNAGFSDIDRLDSDARLDPLKKSARFATIRRRVDKIARPCNYDAKYRAFDFLVGDWTVVDKKGNVVGTSVVSKDLEGCAIRETFELPNGIQTRGYAVYRALIDGWTHFSMTDKGRVRLKDGGVHEQGGLMFEGEIPRRGAPILERARWSPREDGTVAFVAEQSRDGSQNWYVIFDYLYQPAPVEAP